MPVGAAGVISAVQKLLKWKSFQEFLFNLNRLLTKRQQAIEIKQAGNATIGCG